MPSARAATGKPNMCGAITALHAGPTRFLISATSRLRVSRSMSHKAGMAPAAQIAWRMAVHT